MTQVSSFGPKLHFHFPTSGQTSLVLKFDEIWMFSQIILFYLYSDIHGFQGVVKHQFHATARWLGSRLFGWTAAGLEAAAQPQIFSQDSSCRFKDQAQRKHTFDKCEPAVFVFLSYFFFFFLAFKSCSLCFYHNLTVCVPLDLSFSGLCGFFCPQTHTDWM